MFRKFIWAIALLVACCGSCRHSVCQETGADETLPGSRTTNEPAPAGESSQPWHNLLSESAVAQWQPARFGGLDEFEFEDGVLSVEMGYPMAGVFFAGETFPNDQYRLRLEAQKVSGTDFFCCVTFPVGEEFCSLVLGGWGGTVTGLSCIDGQDASDNATKSIRKYERETWYQVEIEVNGDRLICRLDDEIIVDLNLDGVTLSLRPEVLATQPLGICSFATSAKWRNIRYQLIDPSSQTNDR